MNSIKPFKNGEKICFIGDSITASTYWISCIADYYAKNTDKKIEIYPCGVSGGGCQSAIKYFYKQTAVWKPETAVIMLGMNDIGRHYYGIHPDEDKIQKREEALANYENNLRKLTEMLKGDGIKRIIYLAPTPYDEEQNCETEVLYGCWQALQKCCKIMREIAIDTENEFYNFGGEVYELLKESRSLNSSNEIINPDRVHPNKLGMSVMASVFLKAQGFKNVQITANRLCDASAYITLSHKAEEFQKYASLIQRFWSAEWLFLANFPPQKSKEERLAHVKNYTDVASCGEYVAKLALDYESLLEKYDENVKEFKKTIKKLHQ